MFVSLLIQYTCVLVHISWLKIQARFLTSGLCTMHLRSYDVIRGHELVLSNSWWLGWASDFKLSAMRLCRWDESTDMQPDLFRSGRGSRSNLRLDLFRIIRIRCVSTRERRWCIDLFFYLCEAVSYCWKTSLDHIAHVFFFLRKVLVMCMLCWYLLAAAG